MIQKRLCAFLLAFLLLFCGACSPQEQEEEQVVIHYAIAGAWDSLMPYGSVSGSNYARLVYDKIYDRLCFIHADGTLSPRGAERWESEDDGYTIRFYLNEKATFHDGTPVTAQHWAETFVLLTNPDAPIFGRSNFSILSGTQESGARADGEALGVETEGDNVLLLHLKMPMDANEFLLTFAREIYVLPMHLLGETSPAQILEEALWRTPIGSGPCRFVDEVVGSKLTLQAFESERWGTFGFDVLEIRVIDKTNHLSALVSGDIDYYAVGNAISFDNIALAEQQELTVVPSQAYTNFYELMLNNERIAEAGVRKAISLAINRARLAEHTAGTLGTITGSYLLPQDDYSTEPVYDPAQARAILEQVEYDGTVYTLATTSARTGLAALIAQDLEEVGIATEIVTVDSAALFSGMTAGTYDMGIASHTPSTLPLWFIEPRLTADGGIFRADTSDYRILMNAVREAENDAVFQAAMTQLSRYLDDQMPFVPLFFTRLAYVESPTVQGIEYTASSYSNENVWDWVKE